MSRGQGWRFLDLGRKMERATHTAMLLRSTLIDPSPNEGPILDALLEIADSSMTYRRRYLSNLHPAPVLDLLIADETNPRSLAFQVAHLEEQIGCLPQEADFAGRTQEQRLALQTLTTLRLVDIDELATPDEAGRRVRLDALMEQLEKDLPRMSDSLTRQFLTHLQSSRQMGVDRRGGQP
jgi:uncharacterized alpha-E superfamily protein